MLTRYFSTTFTEDCALEEAEDEDDEKLEVEELEVDLLVEELFLLEDVYTLVYFKYSSFFHTERCDNSFFISSILVLYCDFDSSSYFLKIRW